MKKIEAIIKPFKLEEVKDALSEIGIDIEALVNVPEKVVEIAADPLRGNCKRRHMRPGEIPRRLIEKQRLLNFEADLDLSLSLSRRQFFRLPAFCNIPGDL